MSELPGSGAPSRSHIRMLQEALDWRAKESRLRTQTGQRFNPFTAVSSLRDETRHSRVLATFLDPASSHGQGAVLLALFLRELGLTDEESAPTDQAAWRIATEITLGNGSRIDILVEGPGWVIGIENKVDAEEGHGQLTGYAQELAKLAASQRAVGRNTRAALVFLTPLGREPKEGREHLQHQGLDRVLTCSYPTLHDELPSLEAWLNRARQETSNAPPVEHFLTQYRRLVSYLGGQPMDKDESRELARALITDAETFATAGELAQAFFERCVEAQLWFWNELETKLGNKVVYTNNLSEGPVRGYLSGSGRESLSMYYDTGLVWHDYRIVIDIEMLGARDRDNLTWKVMCSRIRETGSDSDDPAVPRTQIPAHPELDRQLAPLKSGWDDSPWSFLTSDLELDNGHTLDLTKFSGYAQQLAGNRNEASTIVDEVVSRITQLRTSLSEHLPAAHHLEQ